MNGNATHEMLPWKALPDPPHMGAGEAQPPGLFARGFVQAKK